MSVQDPVGGGEERADVGEPPGGDGGAEVGEGVAGGEVGVGPNVERFAFKHPVSLERQRPLQHSRRAQ